MAKLFFSALFAGLILACAGKDNSKSKDNEPIDGAIVYKKYCVMCHGVDGKLGLNGSKDITVSTLSKEERMVLITTGKNTMTPFGGILSPEEIEAVAEHTMTMKQ